MNASTGNGTQRDVLRKWIFERFAHCDWHDVEGRKAVYQQASDAIGRMRTDPSDQHATETYRETLAQLTARIEDVLPGCTVLLELEEALNRAETASPLAVSPPEGVSAEAGQTAGARQAGSADPPLPAASVPASPEPKLSGPKPRAEPGEPRIIDRGNASLIGRLKAALKPMGARGWTALGVSVALLGCGLAALLLWQGAPRSECSPTSTTCFDSGWQAVSNKATTVYFFRHRLSAAPRTMNVWFSPSADGSKAYSLLWKFPRNETGNPISIEVKTDVVLVNIWNGVPLFGAYDASNDRWTTYTDGFYRVVMEK